MILSFPTVSDIKDFSRGFCLGVANIIPGVSGGTFLLIFGIYERVFGILNRINAATLSEMLCLAANLVRCQGGSMTALLQYVRDKDFFYLIRLGLGTLAAILGLSGVMKFLLLNHFSVTYALFFGLILVSLVLPVRMFKSFHWRLIPLILAGALLTVWVSWAVNPFDRVKFKSDRLAQAYETAGQKTAGDYRSPGQSGSETTGKYGLKDYLYIASCGALAISATVLPGISGALVLILLGAYFDVIAAISELKAFRGETLAFLSAFAVGIGVGGLMFVRLVTYVLARFYNATMAFLTGLMLGSLYALWPFKEVVVMARQFVREGGGIRVLENVPVYTNVNRLPAGDDPVLWAILSFAAGCLIMAAFVRAETRT